MFQNVTRNQVRHLTNHLFSSVKYRTKGYDGYGLETLFNLIPMLSKAVNFNEIRFVLICFFVRALEEGT